MTKWIRPRIVTRGNLLTLTPVTISYPTLCNSRALLLCFVHFLCLLFFYALRYFNVIGFYLKCTWNLYFFFMFILLLALHTHISRIMLSIQAHCVYVAIMSIDASGSEVNYAKDNFKTNINIVFIVFL